MSLLLFDLDGTILSGLGPYNASLEQAIQETFSKDVKLGFTPTHGKTDRRILKELLEKEDISYSESNINICLTRFGEIYQANHNDINLVPGVISAIPSLSKGNTLGLVTGNVQQMARKKLRLFHINRENLNVYFPFGGFGHESCNRADLVIKAIERGRDYGWNGIDASVIGDTPLDIQAALEASDRLNRKITPIGVTTGNYPREQLLQAGTEYVIDSLIDLFNI